MVILFVVFLLLLVSFDLIVFTVTRNALYEECDSQIKEAEEHILKNPENAVHNFKNGKSIVYYNDGSNYVISYKIFILLRNAEGEILNSDYLYAFDYMLNLDFSRKRINRIVTSKVTRNSDELYYRNYLVTVEQEGQETLYVQLATESSEIEMSLRIIAKVLMLCTTGAMALVLVGGWLLSRTLVSGIVEAWERQDEFISYASHEIRSPLAVIHSSLELLLETPGEKIINRSDLILNSLTESSRLRKMTNNLLEMVRLQAAELPLHEEIVDMPELVDGFIEPFCYQAETTGKTLEYYVQEDLVMAADRQLITELLVILLENALKYTEKGNLIRLSAALQGSTVAIRVEDNGKGISEEGLKKVFSRFYREEKEQAKSDGSGLGLYIAGLIVQAHNGKIIAEPNHPKGVVIKVAIPHKEEINR